MSRKWNEDEINKLKKMFDKGIPDYTIGKKLNRTQQAVKSKRFLENITADPRNRRLTKKAREAMGDKPTGKDSWSWKGGKRINHNGYIEINKPSHHRARGNGYVFEHIIVCENKIGRKLKKDECVHHKNENRKDNSPDNLKVMKKGKHKSYHAKKRKRKGEYLLCPVCKKSFYVKPSHLKARKTCSFKCAGKLFKEYYTGKPRDKKISEKEKERVAKNA